MIKKDSVGTIKKVIVFYLETLRNNVFAMASLAILGFTVRLLSVLTFALIIKIFLSILDQHAATTLVNNLLANSLGFAIERQELPAYLLGLLSAFILTQVILIKLHYYLLRWTRKKLVIGLINKESITSPSQKVHFIYDYFLHGFDALVKIFEILFFYLVLMLFIFYANPVLGGSIIFMIPVLIMILVYKDKGDAFVHRDLIDSRSVVNEDKASQIAPLAYYDGQLRNRVNSVIAADFFGGIVVIVIFLIFIESNDVSSGVSWVALLLIFSIRFAVLYAGELSRHFGTVLKIRIVLD